jgi:hypothetical protein
MGEAQSVLDAVLDAIEDDEGPVLSVYIGSPDPTESLDQLTERLCKEADVPHKKIRRCTVQDLLNAGFKIEHSVAGSRATPAPGMGPGRQRRARERFRLGHRGIPALPRTPTQHQMGWQASGIPTRMRRESSNPVPHCTSSCH